jgi:hypothetical protein
VFPKKASFPPEKKPETHMVDAEPPGWQWRETVVEDPGLETNGFGISST